MTRTSILCESSVGLLASSADFAGSDLASTMASTRFALTAGIKGIAGSDGLTTLGCSGC